MTSERKTRNHVLNPTNQHEYLLTTIYFMVFHFYSIPFRNAIRNPDFFISKEIIQGKDAARFSAPTKQAHLAAALLRPTGKLASSTRFLPDGRYVEDYLWHSTSKLLRTMGVVGFTVNPEHCTELDWATVVRNVRPSDLVVVVFARRNAGWLRIV